MLSSESGEKVELEDNIKKKLHFKPRQVGGEERRDVGNRAGKV